MSKCSDKLSTLHHVKDHTGDMFNNSVIGTVKVSLQTIVSTTLKMKSARRPFARQCAQLKKKRLNQKLCLVGMEQAST